MTFKEMVEVVRGSIDAWNRDDRDGWMAASHPEIEWSSGIVRAMEGQASAYKGHEGLERFFADWHETWQHFTVVLAEFHPAGPDRLLYGGTMEARGRSGGVPLGQDLWFIAEFTDGLQSRVASYRDRAEAFAAAGIEDPGVPG
jgi:ketosteroid isomerase-like protein